MKIAHRPRSRPLEVLCPRAFECFGKILPAGSPDEHLMDARIFRSIQNAVTPNEWVKLGEPTIREMIAKPYDSNRFSSEMKRENWERTILIPAAGQEYALTVAAEVNGQPQQIRTFRLPTGYAVNLNPGVWFSPLFSLGATARYWIISAGFQNRHHAGDILTA